jgi:hypothetical protein
VSKQQAEKKLNKASATVKAMTAAMKSYYKKFFPLEWMPSKEWIGGCGITRRISKVFCFIVHFLPF